MIPKNKRFAELARVVALAPRALYAEFDLDAEAEGESGDEWDDDSSDYDSDDNTTSAQMHRHFAKMASAGIDFGDKAVMCSPTPGLKPRLPPPSALGRKKLRVCHVQCH